MNISEHSYIHGEQMTLIDKESTVSLMGGLIVAVFYTFVLYGKVSSEILLSWLAVISLVYVIRWIITNYIYRLDIAIEGNSYTWEKIYIVGTLIAGSLWGVGSYFIFPDSSPLLDAVIVLTIGGLVAASSIAYAPSKYIGFAFSFPALLPLSIYFFAQDGNEYFYMGVLILIYLLVTFTSSRLMNKANINSIML